MLTISAALYSQSSTFTETLKDGVLSRQAQSQESFVSASLSKGLKNGLGVELSQDKVVNTVAEGFDVEKVVDTVMQFVGKRIDQARQQGVSDGELESMFDAARSGVEQGFSEAREQIQALGKLNEGLGEKIDSAETGIYQGIDTLEKKVLGSDGQDDNVSLSPAIAKPQTQSSDASTKVDYAAAYQQTRESFDFKLTTQDGDKVTISARRSESGFVQFIQSSANGTRAQIADFGADESFAYDLKVKGSLDEGELRAIEDLLSQVDVLSREFYAGDIDEAFALALELESDPSEIARFSLDLSQQQTTLLEAGRYRSVAPAYEQATLPKGLSEPLRDFAEGVKNAYGVAEKFASAQDLMKTLFDQMDVENRMSSLLDPLLEALNQNA